MTIKLNAIPLALAVVLGAPMAAFAMDTNTATPQSTDTTTQAPVYSNPSTGVDTTTPGGGGGQTRADMIKGASDQQIADLPGGHWATYATQIAVGNNLLTLENGQFNGNRDLTADELHHAMDSLVNTSENIAGKGALPDLRQELGVVPTGAQPVSRLEVAQTLTRFLDAANKDGLVAVAASRQQATTFHDLPQVPPAVTAITDKYKIMAGFADHTFRPNGAVTRYQMAAIGKQVLDFMRMAPLAALPMAPTIVVVPQPVEETPVAIAPIVPQKRKNFRANAPIALSWQALNTDNLSSASNGTGFGAFGIVPVAGEFTGYSGPLMLQNVTNFRYNVYSSNLLTSDFRVGYANLKAGAWQLIPYVGANVGVGASIPQTNMQYDSFVGASYGAIVSWLPTNFIELHANAGQTALLGAGRFDQNFGALAYPSALGSFATNYGIGADFYVQPNIALTLAFDNQQQPADLSTAATQYSGNMLNTMGGSVGVGFRF